MKKCRGFFWTLAQFATLREILALLHHWVLEVGFTRARFHPLHVDNNKTRLSTMGADSQQLYSGQKHELLPEGTSNNWSFPWPCCHPGSRLGGPGAPQRTAWPQGNICQSSGGGAGMSCQGQDEGRKVPFSSRCSFTTRWLQRQNHLAGSLLQPQPSAPMLEPMAPSAGKTASKPAL